MQQHVQCLDKSIIKQLDVTMENPQGNQPESTEIPSSIKVCKLEMNRSEYLQICEAGNIAEGIATKILNEPSASPAEEILVLKGSATRNLNGSSLPTHEEILELIGQSPQQIPENESIEDILARADHNWENRVDRSNTYARFSLVQATGPNVADKIISSIAQSGLEIDVNQEITHIANAADNQHLTEMIRLDPKFANVRRKNHQLPLIDDSQAFYAVGIFYDFDSNVIPDSIDPVTPGRLYLTKDVKKELAEAVSHVLLIKVS